MACTDGAQTSVPQTVTVKNDYAAELTFFAATIQVTYPAGSTCTAADGVTTLTAPDTSGSWKCTVPNAGTWTVSCTDGSETDSDSVSIASDGQSASVTLTYRTMIYDLGWGDTASGFQSHYTGPTSSDRWPITVTYENGYIVMNRTTYNGGACVYTNVGFDLTDVDTVCCKTGDIGSGSGADSGSIYFGVGKASSYATAKVKLTASNTEYTLDVSALTGEYRIGFYGPVNNSADWKWTNRKIEAFWF